MAVAVLEAGREHAERPVVLDEEPLLLELGHDHGQQRVVEALPHRVLGCEEDTQQVVDLLDVGHRLGHEDPPQPHSLGIAALEQHDPSPAAIGERRVTVELATRGGIELVEVPRAEGLGPLGSVHVEQVLDQHAEGRPPVPDVVLAPDLVTEKTEHAGQGVADQGAAQVADVHLLGHVRRRIVDHDPLGAGCGRHAQARVG